MKFTPLITRLLGFAPLLFVTFMAQGQMSYSVHATGAIANYPYASFKPGGGVSARLFISPSFAVGMAAKYTSLEYRHKQSSSSIITNTGALIPVTATAEVYLSKGFVRPYRGLEAGAYVHVLKTNVEANGRYQRTYLKPGMAPKLGISFKINKLSLFTEGSYSFLIGSTNGSVTDQTVRFKWPTPNQYWLFNAGVAVGIPHSK